MLFNGVKPVRSACDRCCGCGFIDKKKSMGRAPAPVPVEERDLMRLMNDGD